MVLVEVCAGSLSDCYIAQLAGANRIELNQGLHLGGLTPSLGTLRLAKSQVTLPIICMVRPRGAGFCYTDTEKAVMRLDAQLLLEAGADGLAMGSLTETGGLDVPFISEMIQLTHQMGKEFVFHRAFDVACDMKETAAQLIDLGCDRILTSGGGATALAGCSVLADLQAVYGQKIEFCMGAGVTAENVSQLVARTGIKQIHASFKTWQFDSTSARHGVDYSYAVPNAYDSVGQAQIKALLQTLSQIKEGENYGDNTI